MCVKKNKSQYMEGLSYPAARGIGLIKERGIGKAKLPLGDRGIEGIQQFNYVPF